MKARKILCIVMVVLAACLVMVGCSSDGSGSSKKESKSSEVSVGKTLHAQNFDFKVETVKYASSLKNGLGMTYTPDKGNKYIIAVVKATNTSDETQNVFAGDFNSYLDDDEITVQSDVAGKIDGHMPLDGAVKAGKSMTGHVVWQIPKSKKWKKLTCSYIDAGTGEESEKSLKITPKDIK
ncbi:MAG: DUF4352 domain-containing protein [Coriobacteriales bacterium]|jgi:hypothetical protein